MMVVVTFVSLMVHVYTIGYMAEDPGYQRFFSYISLFTFSMLMLVMANNFLQLFFGWEAVGLVSYLLIGFWYTRPTAIYANMKAFIVNRVGDFGFILGIGLILAHFGTLDYSAVFSQAPAVAGKTIEVFSGSPWLLMSVICICLFVGAMGKSAQFPLHVWLPDSMEGPTPISALIHAATMVTAGIFMVARMSPLFELSETALSVVLVIGAITALFMAMVAITQFDIKRVVAYSTLSQLGYMTMALGASAYPVAIFHLMTHAFFKAVLFLGAGSVIIAMHHEQDMRRMGGLKKYMPITYWTVVVGALANAGFPPFAGFFSKDTIIEALHASHTPGATFAYLAALAGVFFAGLYSLRLVFLTFHGAERMDAHTREHLHETPWVVTLPLILLAIPSVVAGWTIGTVVYGEYFGTSIQVVSAHPAMMELAGGIPRRGRDDAARRDGAALLARPRGRRHGMVLLHRPPRPAQGRSREIRRGLRDRRAQVRLRRALFLAARRGRPPGGQRPVEVRRPEPHRRPGRERLGAPGRLDLAHRAPVPDRPGLPVRIYDDHRRVRAAHPLVCPNVTGLSR